MQGHNIGVVYLAWLPYGIGHFKSFLASYRQYSPGYRHHLIIAFNGKPTGEKDAPAHYIELLEKSQIIDFSEMHFEGGQDVSIYKEIAARVNHDFLLFLNTYSIILCDNWLGNFVANQKDGVGLLGASGSYAGYVTSINKTTVHKLRQKDSLSSKINLIKYALKLNFLFSSKFEPFPNPHIRTTGFFISRKLLNEIILPGKNNKMGAYLFENGRHSLTNQVLRRSLKCLVVDRNGMGWDIYDWQSSNTFRTNRQEGLMISDNQTRRYLEAPPEEGERLTHDAWGNI